MDMSPVWTISVLELLPVCQESSQEEMKAGGGVKKKKDAKWKDKIIRKKS